MKGRLGRREKVRVEKAVERRVHIIVDVRRLCVYRWGRVMKDNG